MLKQKFQRQVTKSSFWFCLLYVVGPINNRSNFYRNKVVYITDFGDIIQFLIYYGEIIMKRYFYGDTDVEPTWGNPIVAVLTLLMCSSIFLIAFIGFFS